MIFFTVLGNHEDRKGNPIGYTRMTQRGKWLKPEAQRYEAWKEYVWTSLLKQEPKPPRYENGQKIVVSCYIEYRIQGPLPSGSRKCGKGYCRRPGRLQTERID